MKLGLGTVQFGLNYGINNKIGKPGPPEVQQMLDLARRKGINLIDTAADYGDSEETIGNVLGDDSHFFIVTKVSRSTTAEISLRHSLTKLRRKNIYGLLLHDFEQFLLKERVVSELLDLKKDGWVDKIGFSLYLPEQLELLLDKQVPIDLIQIPYSMLDQRFESYFPILKNHQVEIHVRSVYVQGLVFMDPTSLKSFFEPVKEKIIKLNVLSKESGKSIQSLCLNFAASNDQIDKIIVGVESTTMLNDNISSLDQPLSDEELSSLRALNENDERIILPYNWK